MRTTTTLRERADTRLHSPTGRWLTLAGAAALWLTAYRLNAPAWDLLLHDVLGLDPTSRVTESVRFFCYDSVKIALLLIGIIFVVTVLRSYMSVERTRALLGGRREGAGNVMAAGLGVVTPFCSCSAVPAFIGFVAAGVPIGVTLSFLIASPLVNEIAVGLLASLFGWRIAALYIAAGLTVAIVAGWVLGRLGVQRWVEPFVFETRLHGQIVDSTAHLTLDDRFALGVEEVRVRSCARSGPTSWSGSAWAQSSTAGPRRTCSPATPEPARRSASRWQWRSGCPSTRTRPGSCPWCRRCTTRACRWAPCSPS